MSVEMALGHQATSIAEDIAQQLDGQAQVIREFGCRDQVRAAAAGAPRIDVPHDVPVESRHGIRAGITAQAIQRIWASGRIIYALHPQLLASLADSSADQLPGSIFSYLPHTNPLIVFPDPIPTTTPDDAAGRLLGFYVYGRLSSGGLCSSHDEDRDRLGLMFVTAIHDEVGRRVDTDLTRVSIPVGDDRFTVEEAVDRTLAAFAPDAGLLMLTGRMRTWLTELIRTAINVLLYLCSQEPDTVEAGGRPGGRRTGKQKKPTPARMIKVGWRLGAALSAERREAAEAAAQPGGSGRRRPAPHQRRGHFRTFWTGHGRTTPIVRFIKPYWVNLDTSEGPTEHKVIPIE